MEPMPVSIPTSTISISTETKPFTDRRQKASDFFRQAFFLVLTVLLTWFWVRNPVLANYNLQLTAILVLIYFLGRFFWNKKEGSQMLIFDVLIFTVILLLVLSSTSGLGSPFFFLVYFLLFAVALLFDPPITLTLTLALTLFFTNTLISIHAVLQLLSLLFISPLAIYFGKQYLRLLEAQTKIKILAKKEKVLTREKNELSENVTTEETDALLWLSLNFKNGLLSIGHLTSDLLSDIGHLTGNQKEKLQSIHESAKELLKSGEKLREKIDRETDE